MGKGVSLSFLALDDDDEDDVVVELDMGGDFAHSLTSDTFRDDAEERCSRDNDEVVDADVGDSGRSLDPDLKRAPMGRSVRSPAVQVLNSSAVVHMMSTERSGVIRENDKWEYTSIPDRANTGVICPRHISRMLFIAIFDSDGSFVLEVHWMCVESSLS